MTAESAGRIITFYSYKGGTGRSMALANVAWILASQGLRVLAIDWDLEAPGLHRYFHPFLEDRELENSPGLIDYVVEFSEAARHAARQAEPSEAVVENWYDKYTSLLRYTYSLDWDFGPGTLDFVPAGQQGPGYALRVNGFDWQDFYEKLGGGVLLEALKNRLREDYDYVLIDSRTGISDTSGTCTVQMPDDLVVCFTFNQQSVKGAAAVAGSADLQRRRSTGEPSLKIWPVPTRVELAEKDRLEAARTAAHATFQHYLGHLKKPARPVYWSGVEILYQPYFAYEEVLAVFAEKRRQRASLLSSLEYLTGELTQKRVTALAEMSESERLRGLALFHRTRPTALKDGDRGRIFISCAYDDIAAVEPLVARLQERFGELLWWDRSDLRPGDAWEAVIDGALRRATIVLALFGPNWAKRSAARHFEPQVARALLQGKRVVPVLVGGLRVSEWAAAAERLELAAITERHALRIGEPSDPAMDILMSQIEEMWHESVSADAARPTDLDDPQKGRWGGRASASHRTLAAGVRAINEDWFEVLLTVTGTSDLPLTGTVEFHLHPTFAREVERVDAIEGTASLKLAAWGAFTVGALADDGATMLELDLAEDSTFPELFRSR